MAQKGRFSQPMGWRESALCGRQINQKQKPACRKHRVYGAEIAADFWEVKRAAGADETVQENDHNSREADDSLSGEFFEEKKFKKSRFENASSTLTSGNLQVTPGNVLLTVCFHF